MDINCCIFVNMTLFWRAAVYLNSSVCLSAIVIQLVGLFTNDSSCTLVVLSFLSVAQCLSRFFDKNIPTLAETAEQAWWHNPKKLDLANFISSASCVLGSQSQQKKNVKWKCCIKPLIRVEHIRIILHAQSGSCYTAACVELLAVVSPSHRCAYEEASDAQYATWYILRVDFKECLRCIFKKMQSG